MDDILALLKERCLAGGLPEFNFSQFDAAETPVHRVLEAVRTLPVMCPRRLVVVRDANQFDSSSWELLSAYIRDPSATSCLVFKAHGPPRDTNVQGLLRKTGAFLEVRVRTRRDARQWIIEEANRMSKRIDPEAAWALLERAGTHQGDLRMELEKALVYVGDSPVITEQDIQEVAAGAPTQRIFDLTDAVSEGRTRDAVKCLHGLLEEGVSPLRILGMLARQIRLLWIARVTGPGERWGQGMDIPDFVRSRLLKAAPLWSIPRLIRALDGLHKIDMALKGSSIRADVLLDHWIMQVGKGADVTAGPGKSPLSPQGR
jgi:DNA polymerase-3 subunit delta